MAQSIVDRSISTGGRSTGFDYLRISLAVAVICWHSFPLSYGSAAETAKDESVVAELLIGIILPMFFSLSGFLVAGSLERNKSLTVFIGLRVIRILPALAVEVVLSALILGPALTILSLHSYLTDVRFFTYFLNIIGDIHYHLPGLFLSNPTPDVVNGQLWTVPWELKCYVLLTALALLGLVSKRIVLIGITAFVAVFFFVWHLRGGFNQAGMPLLIGFLVGVAIHRYKDLIPWSLWLALFCITTMLAFLFIPGGDYIAAFPAGYLTVYLGLTNPKKALILQGADYSYGLYLYGFAIQQAVARIFPWSHQWYINLALSLPIAAVFAAMSWAFIEKPALRLRFILPKLNALIDRGQKLINRRCDEA